MEDSYTVHRRRKAAAAKRRDKTPDEPRRPQEEPEKNEQESEDARARIEKMVEDTEKMEIFANDGRTKPDQSEILKTKEPETIGIVEEKENSPVINKLIDEVEDTRSIVKGKSDKIENRTERRRTKSSSGEITKSRAKKSEERWSTSESNPDDDRSMTNHIIENKLKDKKIPRKVRKERSVSRENLKPLESAEEFISYSGKRIIPLNDNSLIKDLEKAQLEYEKRDIGIFDVIDDDYIDPKMLSALRRRKKSKSRQKVEKVEEQVVENNAKGWKFWSWWKFSSSNNVEDTNEHLEPSTNIKQKEKTPEKKINIPQKKDEVIQEKKNSKIILFFKALRETRAELKAFIQQNPHETDILRKHRNRCIAELILIIIYCGLGAFIFRFTEGAFETFYKCGVKRVKRDFLDSLWNYSHNMREDDWKSMARRKLMEFEEQLHAAHEAGLHSYSGQKSWTFLNAVVYCLTVITTIGYGHISPSTTTGRAITIVYAIFGIPMFLIILADFGKLFTRGIKFLWAFVRRVYYTGSCRRVRRRVPVQEVMKGVQYVYDFATFRRPSQLNPDDIAEMSKQQTQAVLDIDGNAPGTPNLTDPGTPATPAMSAYEIDDEFNLPISVAITILLIYIFVGATAYNIWERWGFFESFYFVFISMSTIGFGDYVPKHPIYMMCSIVYLVFGLALTSMCINVVQVMLSDSFKQASQKIGATIGFEVVEDDGSIQPAAPLAVEVADVHTTIKEEDESKEVNKMPPKAKEEDINL